MIAGSGLVSAASSLWIVGDDLHHLIRIDPGGDLVGEGYRIFPGELPEDYKLRKRVKPDTECLICLPSNGGGVRLLAFPSGSKSHRVRASAIDLDGEGAFLRAKEIDFSGLLHFLDKQVPDLNVEGGVVHGDSVLLFQRGNGSAGFNAIIEFAADQFEACLRGALDKDRLNPRISEAQLPMLDGTRLTFTDAAVHDGEIYFSAAAEGGRSTFNDGEVAGSAIGRLDGAPEILAQIDAIKVEGLAFARSDAHSLTFFAVTDADEAQTASLLLEAQIPRRA